MNFNNFNFEATGWALGHLPSLPNASSRLIFLNLAGRFNENEGASRPGVARIAADAADVGATERTVQRALRNLEQIGILRTHPRHNKPSLYFLNFDFVCAGVGDKKSPQNKKVNLGVTKSRSGGDRKSPKQIIEQISEQTTTTARCCY